MKRSALWRLTTGLFSGFAILSVSGLTLLAFGAATEARAAATPRLKPPAPGPAFLSVSDRDRLHAVADALKRKRFPAARAEAALIGDPIAKSLGEWMYFMAEDPGVDHVEADAFLDAHSAWPAGRRIQSFVEERIPNDAPAHEVLAFFASRPPATGEGKVQLARAFFSTGDQETGEAHLRDAWINHNFDLAEERRILKVYGGRLSREDHAARVDRLLWSRQVTNARRVIPRLAGQEKRMAEARAALLLGASNASNAYRRLSRDQQLDAGVLHAAVRYHRRKGEEQYALSLLADAPKTPEALRNPARWWDERQLLMRWALREGRFADAYRAVVGHALEPGGDFAEAEFNAGWIALRFLNDPSRAETHFLALASAVGAPISLSRAYYWLGRAAKAGGEDDAARTYYEKAAEHYYSYYGQLAAEKLGGPALQQRFAPPAASTPEDRALFSSRPTVAALRMLSDLDLDYEFMVFAYHVDDQLERPGEYVELAKLTNGEGAPHLTVRAGKVAVRRGAFTPDVAYPLVFVPEEAEQFVAREIVLGLSRQESEFNPRAFSRAGARGMMQLIPSTAQITARKEGLTYSRSALLDDPVYNMTLGSAHLSHLIDRYDGSLIMTLAAYNAGASRVTRWMDNFGDPRSPAIDPVDWVELIPFSETRNYVQRVLENVQVYRGLLNEAPIPGRLAADLERGGPGDRVANGAAPSVTLIVAAGGLNAEALPPPPERTVEKAQKFAMLLTADAAPQSDATAPTATQDAPEAAPEPRLKQSAPAPSTPTPETRGEAVTQDDLAATPAPTAPLPSETEETAARLQETAPQALTTDGPIETPARADVAPVAAPSPANAQPENAAPAPPDAEPAIVTSPPPDALLQQPMLGVIKPVAVPTAAATNGDSELDDCLAYRAFLARNAEDEAGASDLNAGMLAELRGGGGCK